MTRADRAATDPARRPMDVASLRDGAIVVGLMSGTSLDGISAAVVRFADTPTGTGHTLLGVTQRAYTPEERARLAAALQGATPQEYCRLHVDLGAWLADAAVAAIAEAGVARGDVAAIASHGQTVWHEPGHGTWQIGDPSVIAERTGCDVVADFRARDMAAGGQGAPLVPLADALLYAAPTAWRALQNIGGIGNVTVVPPGGDLAGVRAFDTGPGVVLIDALARRAAPELPFDVDGRLAARGAAIEAVVMRRLSEPYFLAPPPKSTGRELFSAAYAAALAHEVESAGGSPFDAVATAVELTARSIADAYARFAPEPVTEVLVSGGGARHPALMARLAALLAPRAVRPFTEVVYDGEAKEAVAFALMGWRHLCGDAGNVPGATGAAGPRVLGVRVPA